MKTEATTMNSISVLVDVESEGERIDKYLSFIFPASSRSYIQKAIDSGNVLVNGKTVTKNYKLKANDGIEYTPLEPVKLNVEPQNIPLDIVYEDEDLLVVNKPKGMVVHPAAGNFEGTLVNALLYHCGDSLSGINGVLRPGIVHRIDKDTSGLLIVAKNDFAHRALAEQIKEHSFSREYRAVVTGHLKEQKGTVVAPIGRNPKDRKKMAVTDVNSKNAVTHYEVLEQYSGYDYIKCVLETGRTHQIRVHMAYSGHPLAGDAVYSKPKPNELKLNGQCLHAALIGFIHPRTGEYMEFKTELPDWFTQFLNSLTKQ
jgi:23S rRNA pseudouridine1911/1915/1917 synthase